MALHVLGEDGGHRPGSTTVTRELCPHTGTQVVKIQGRGEGVCFPSNKQTNQADLLVTMFQLLQAATEELVCCLPTRRGDKVRKSYLAPAILRGRAKLNLADESLAIDCSSSQLFLHFMRNLQNTHKCFHPGHSDARCSPTDPSVGSSVTFASPGGAASPVAHSGSGQVPRQLPGEDFWKSVTAMPALGQAGDLQAGMLGLSTG